MLFSGRSAQERSLSLARPDWYATGGQTSWEPQVERNDFATSKRLQTTTRSPPRLSRAGGPSVDCLNVAMAAYVFRI